VPVIDKDEVTSTPMLDYARLLRESHDLLAQGRGDSAEAEALAERMDQPWYAMTADEQQRMRGLSADLNALLDGGPKRVEMSPEVLARWQGTIKDAHAQAELGNVDDSLAALRKPIPSELPPHIIPFLQARCWERLGDLETSLIFMKEAERSDPEQTLTVLTLLQRAGKINEAEQYAERIVARPDSGPLDLYLAASAWIPRTRELSAKEAEPTLRRIAMVLERAEAALAVIPREQWEIPNLDGSIAFALGLCHERLGDLPNAIRVYNAGLKRNPSDGELLVARGLARYGKSTPEAFQDFQGAVRLGARSIWAWHILSRHALVAGANGDALRLALRAADRAGPSSVRAEVYETIAIALANLGQPLDWVLQNFATALRLDPTNERIRHNQGIALALAETPGARTVKDWQRSLTIDRVHPGRLRQCHMQEAGSRQDAIIDQREARIGDHVLVGARH
jgi:tetratricopeptide (TPR) repeat protein